MASSGDLDEVAQQQLTPELRWDTALQVRSVSLHTACWAQDFILHGSFMSQYTLLTRVVSAAFSIWVCWHACQLPV